MNTERLLVLTLAAATWWMTGLVWFVQVVHYPLFKNVGQEHFEEYHAQHVRLTMPVVLVPMVLELVLSILLAVTGYGANSLLDTAGAACAVFIWGITGVRQLADHEKLAGGYDQRAIERLVRGNAVRTAAWTVHAMIVFMQCLIQA